MRFTVLALCGAVVAMSMLSVPGQTARSDQPPSAQSGSSRRAAGRTLKVSAVQMRSSKNLEENLAKTIRFIQRGAKDGVRVVVFPECAVTGYFEDVIRQTTAEQLADAEARIGQACKEANIYAVVGMPSRKDGRLFNSALIFSPAGTVIERFHKMQLVEGWPSPGDHLSIYRIDGVWCTTIICHDERYPELVRLPVLAGAQVVFYLSHESGLKEEKKLAPYRAQIQARAVENGVFVAHANAPANEDASGSHGQSRIIGPDGNIMAEASMLSEEVVTATLDPSKANRNNATGSLRSSVLGPWWQEGLKLVRRIE